MKRSCFTVIELIVVIATIALLMAILLPAMRNSREQARAIVCSSNIKQLMLGMLNYEAEYQTLPYAFDGQFPQNEPPGGYTGNLFQDGMGWWWFNFIDGFYEKSDSRKTAIKCPSKRLSSSVLRKNILCGNYGVNQSICKRSMGWHTEYVETPLRISSISRSGETLLIVDSGYATISWWHATDEPPVVFWNFINEDTAYIPGLWINEEKNLWPGQKYDAVNGRHPNKTVNVGFVDSHVSRVEADILFVEKITSGYKNKSPLWEPN